jgi:hypothetical protein
MRSRDETLEVTKSTEKIHNEGTKKTETYEEDCGLTVVRRPTAGVVVGCDLLRSSFVRFVPSL